MKETGIIMSGDHPKKILDGTKTMTRRVIKDPRRKSRERDAMLSFASGKPSMGDLMREAELNKNRKPNFPCPYGQVGDRLWVRETWMPFGFVLNNGIFIHYKASINENGGERLLQRPKDTTFEIDYKWQPSIFMPRWASRITLEITEVRVERLQEITEEDCKAEGIVMPDVRGKGKEIGEATKEYCFNIFKNLWDSLNDKRGFGWETNPWVWVISFRKEA